MKKNNLPSISQDILAESADWLMCLNEGKLSPQQQQDFKLWQQTSPEHGRAWQKAQRLLHNFDDLPSDIAMLALNRPADDSRRAAMLKLALFIGAVPLVGGGYYQLNKKQAGYVSQTGEQRTITLPDGSELLLNTNTKLDVKYQSHQRLIHLRGGEILVQTAANDNLGSSLGKNLAANRQTKRPFIVLVNNIELEALGTRFIVRTASTNKNEEQHYLAVTEGAVEVNLTNKTEKIIINAGEQVYFTDTSIQKATPVTAVNIAWVKGMLMADNQPLADFITELSRYRNGYINVDSRINKLAVSGSFPLNNMQKTLSMLSATYPIKIQQRFGNYWLAIKPK